MQVLLSKMEGHNKCVRICSLTLGPAGPSEPGKPRPPGAPCNENKAHVA